MKSYDKAKLHATKQEKEHGIKFHETWKRWRQDKERLEAIQSGYIVPTREKKLSPVKVGGTIFTQAAAIVAMASCIYYGYAAIGILFFIAAIIANFLVLKRYKV